MKTDLLLWSNPLLPDTSISAHDTLELHVDAKKGIKNMPSIWNTESLMWLGRLSLGPQKKQVARLQIRLLRNLFQRKEGIANSHRLVPLSPG